jgi:hypothetical protein
VNLARDGRELDFRWPAARLVAETDGWATHKTRAASGAAALDRKPTESVEKADQDFLK